MLLNAEDSRRLANVKKRQKTQLASYRVASLFAGCGGLDLGFQGGFSYLGMKYPKRKFEIVWANEIDEKACQTYRANFKHEIICENINKLIEEDRIPEKVDVVLGGFPCQDFSLAGNRMGFKSKRGVLYKSMVQIVQKTRPLAFVAENVRGLLNLNGGRNFEQILQEFRDIGYHVAYKLHHAANYGVPQSRERVIVVGTLKSKLPPFEHPEPPLVRDQWITLKEAIGDLANKKEGWLSNHFWSKAKMFPGTQGNSYTSADKIGPTMRAEHHGNIEWHWNRKRRLSAREAARIQTFPDDFVFGPSTSSAYKQIGNAVPPVLGWYVATGLQNFLDDKINPPQNK